MGKCLTENQAEEMRFLRAVYSILPGGFSNLTHLSMRHKFGRRASHLRGGVCVCVDTVGLCALLAWGS